VQRAREVLKKSAPALAKAVEAGKLKVSAASGAGI